MKSIDELRRRWPNWRYWDRYYVVCPSIGQLSTPLSRYAVLEFVLAQCSFYYQTAHYITGGAFHIVLDDGNTTPRNVQWCLNEIPASDHLSRSLGHALLLLTEEELEILYAHYEEYAGIVTKDCV